MEPLEIPYIKANDFHHTITRQSLFDIHETQLLNEKYNDQKMKELVDILGGIDKILSHYLSSQIPILTQTQLNQIDNIITSNIACSNDSNDSIMKYTFNTSNTFMNRCFNTQHAMKINNIIYNKITIIFLLIMGFTYYIWNFLIWGSWNTLYYGYQLIFLFLALIWVLFIVLSANINAFILSTKSFLFWFKILLALRLSIAYLFLLMYVEWWGKSNESNLNRIGIIIGRIADLFMVIAVCVYDSFNVSRRIKVSLMVSVSIWYSSLAILNTFATPKIDESVVLITSNISFSVYESFTSSYRVLSIFLWKQTISSILKPHRCINIRNSPYIQWE